MSGMKESDKKRIRFLKCATRDKMMRNYWMANEMEIQEKYFVLITFTRRISNVIYLFRE
jgi:hypothetical protein